MTKKKNGRVLGFTLARSQWGNADYGTIHTTARLFIGIRQSTDMSMKQIAEHFGVTVARLRQYERDLSSHRKIASVIRDGLPAEYGIEAEFSAKCRDCESLIFQFPCVSCCTMQGYAPRKMKERELVPCQLPTWHLPGSPEKVAVMAARVQMGMAPFNDEDISEDSWHGPTDDRTFEEVYADECGKQQYRL